MFMSYVYVHLDVRILFGVSVDVHHSVFLKFTLNFVYVHVHVSVHVYA